MFSFSRPVKLTSSRTTGTILRLHGVGFKSFCNAGVAAFQLGYSHFLVRKLPKEGSARTHKQVIALFSSRGNLVHSVQQLRVPNSFTRRGVYPLNNVPTVKEGKKR
jgi:ribosomal protein L6P/L9E